jgi:hypothetical protein
MSFSDAALRLMTAGLIHVVDQHGVLRSYSLESYAALTAAQLRNSRAFFDIVEARRFANRAEEPTHPALCAKCGEHTKAGERCSCSLIRPL